MKLYSPRGKVDKKVGIVPVKKFPSKYRFPFAQEEIKSPFYEFKRVCCGKTVCRILKQIAYFQTNRSF